MERVRSGDRSSDRSLRLPAVDALVPLKRLDQAKTRLAAELDPPARVRLMRALLDRTLHEVERTPSIGRVILVSSDPASEGIATGHGIEHFDDRGLPWNEALAAAVAERVTTRAVLILSADIPLVSVDDVEALIAAMPESGVAIARARDAGTNGVAMHPAGAFTTCFGSKGSAALHAARAEAAGLRAVMVDRPGLAIDLDSPDDAHEVLSRGGSAAVRTELARFALSAQAT